MVVKSLLAKLGIDTTEFEAGMKRGLDTLKAHEKQFRNIGLTMTAIGGVMTAFFAKSISEAASSEAAQAKLSAALLNVKGAAKDGAEKLIKYSEALQQNTGIEDDEIVKAQALLATFGLNERQIAALTPRVLDMAVAHSKATGEQVDLNGATMALGRAVTGHMELLGRQGVVLSEQTKKTGDLNLMLKDLDKAFGGAAAAAGQTFAGQMNILKLSTGDVMKAIGKELLPVLLPLVIKAKEIAKSIGEWIEKHKGLVSTLVPIIAGLGVLNTLFGPMVMFLPKIAGGFNAVAQALLGLKIQAATPIMITIGIVGGVALAKTLNEIREFYEKNVSHKYIAQEDRDWQKLIRTLGEWSTIAKDIETGYRKQNQYSKESYAIVKTLDDIWQKYGTSTRQAMEAILKGEAGPAAKKILQDIMEAHGGAAQAAGKQGKATETLVADIGKLPPVYAKIAKIVAETPLIGNLGKARQDLIDVFQAWNDSAAVTFSFIGATSKSTVLKLVDDFQFAKEFLKKNAGEMRAKFQETFAKIADVVLNITGRIGDIFSQSFKNRSIEIDNEFQKRSTVLDQTYLKEKTTLEATAATKKAAIEADAVAKAARVEKEVTDEQQKADMLKAIEQEKQAKLTALDAETKAALEKQEQDHTDAKAEIEQKLEKEKKRIARDQAKVSKALATMEAIVGTASAIVKALPNIPLAIAIGILGAAQIAMIASTPLPSLAKGGYFDRPTLAVVGDVPEWVIPESRFALAASTAGEQINKGRAASVVTHIHNHIYIAGHEIREEIIKIVQQGANRRQFTFPSKVIA